MLNFVRKGIFWDCEIVRCTSNAIELVPLDRLQPSCTRPGSIANQFTNLKMLIFNIGSAQTLKFIFQQFHFTYKQRVSANCLDFLMVDIIHLYYRKAPPCSTTMESEPSPREFACNGFQILWFNKPALYAECHFSILHQLVFRKFSFSFVKFWIGSQA